MVGKLHGSNNYILTFFYNVAASAFINLLTCFPIIHHSDNFDLKTKHKGIVSLQSSKTGNHIDRNLITCMNMKPQPVIKLSTDKWFRYVY